MAAANAPITMKESLTVTFLFRLDVLEEFYISCDVLNFDFSNFSLIDFIATVTCLIIRFTFVVSDVELLDLVCHFRLLSLVIAAILA